ncbi:unnamed protein product [Protopolystoma xenopodis]|uniref:Uncharacterized protein n=1 Tax=Protopolystoma xenopodis TaxID=117903 RepID=A0A448X4L8_9PLAT|nr:unnamed protein product [Protopolystoma xenopodis]
MFPIQLGPIPPGRSIFDRCNVVQFSEIEPKTHLHGVSCRHLPTQATGLLCLSHNWAPANSSSAGPGKRPDSSGAITLLCRKPPNRRGSLASSYPQTALLPLAWVS